MAPIKNTSPATSKRSNKNDVSGNMVDNDMPSMLPDDIRFVSIVTIISQAGLLFVDMN